MSSAERDKQRQDNLKQAALRAPKFTSAKQIQSLVDEYFEKCKGHYVIEETTGFPVVHPKTGLPIVVDQCPPTMSGLALYLGFASRTGLLRYAGKKEFADVITRAKSRVEQYMEERLFDKDGANGAKFALQNNFKGWQESAKVAAQEAANNAVRIVCDFPRPLEVKKPSEDSATVPVVQGDPLPEPDDALVYPDGDGGMAREDDINV